VVANILNAFLNKSKTA